jgi:molecular chaperone Hsp33
MAARAFLSYPMSELPTDEPTVLPVRSYFVRQRNALLVRGKFSDLYMDYYLHLMEHELRYAPEEDGMLKDTLAAVVLHSCSRPQDETVAWTIHLQRPLINLFVTCSTHPGWVSGRVFTEDVRDMGKGLFSAQTKRHAHATRQSMVDFSHMDVLEAIEHFYGQSEQRVTRLFRGENDEMTLVTAQPDCDEEWLLALDAEELEMLPETHHLTLMETRGYKFHCGCSMEKLFPVIGRLPEEDVEHIFNAGPASITCPRCGARFRASREEFRLWLDAQG